MMMDRRATERIAPHLRPGEALLWAARPNPLIWMCVIVLPRLAFIAVWLSIIAVWTILSLGQPDGFAAYGPLFRWVPYLMWSFGIAMVLLALSRIPFAWRIAYGVTNERVVIVEGLFGDRVRVVAPEHLPQMAVREVFLPELAFPKQDYQYHRFTVLTLIERFAFIGIDNPRRVEALIRQNLLRA